MPESSAHPQPSQSVRPEPTPGPIPEQMEQIAQIVAIATRQQSQPPPPPREVIEEPGRSIERVQKTGRQAI